MVCKKDITYTVILNLHTIQAVLSFQTVDRTLVCDHSNESYRAVLSCGTVYYAVHGGPKLKSGNKTLLCDHSNESYRAVLSCGTVYYPVQGGSKFYACG